jgi:hypothetical protein
VGAAYRCFLCLVQKHVCKALDAKRPFAPVDIVSKVRSLAKNFSFGAEVRAPHGFESMTGYLGRGGWTN